jgi:hypothetical protein
MKRTIAFSLSCIAALAQADSACAADVAAATAHAKAPKAATAVDARTQQRSHFSDPTVVYRKELAGSDLPAYDDFLHRAVAQKRIELVRFVDRDDRRVFLGLTRNGLGIHVQKRDR